MALQGTSIVSLNGAFPSLGAVGGDLYIYSNSQLTTFGTAFANLRIVQGTLTFSYHRTAAFTSLAGAFPQLTNVTGNLYLQYNDYLSTVTGAFPRLKWVTGMIYPCVYLPRPPPPSLPPPFLLPSSIPPCRSARARTCVFL
jgi:hypothetical protein